MTSIRRQVSFKSRRQQNVQLSSWLRVHKPDARTHIHTCIHTHTHPYLHTHIRPNHSDVSDKLGLINMIVHQALLSIHQNQSRQHYTHASKAHSYLQTLADRPPVKEMEQEEVLTTLPTELWEELWEELWAMDLLQKHTHKQTTHFD